VRKSESGAVIIAGDEDTPVTRIGSLVRVPTRRATNLIARRATLDG